ncbi:leucine-rich repeat domain-containing protein [Chryseobacterium sp. RLHN22]|uniref:leucine-rich repeat domain-containing protein n=1 Tax=Chryseobacterium sp. RLHN22 TaxID=3437885 RepID=UPI003D9B5A80
MKKIAFASFCFLFNLGFSQFQEAMRMPPAEQTDLSKESDRVLLRQVDKIPDNIFSWNVKTLIISESDNLKSIPPKISNFKNLEKFVITGGHGITDFPKEFASLDNLKILNIHNMQSETIPLQIFNLKGLEELEFIRYSYFSFPKEIGKLKTLKKLMLTRGLDQRSRENVKSKDLNLPSTIKNLVNLESLSCSANLMTALPEEIGSLSSLQDLSLSNNSLEKLPNSFSKLRELKTLNLHNNFFKVFPASIYDLENLKRLDIYKNNIESFPTGMSKMKSLTGLFINDNNISNEDLPEIYNLENLEVLDIRNNKITAFPVGIEKMKKLKVIYLNGNNVPNSEIDQVQIKLPNLRINMTN